MADADTATFDGRRPGAIGAGVRVILQETPVTFAVLGAIAIVRGFAPAAVAVLAGRAVDAVASGGGHSLTMALAGIAFLYGADQVAESLTFPVEEGWALRLYSRVEERAMRALTGPPLLDHLLDADVQRLADLAGRQEWPNIAPFSTSCLRAVTWLVAALAQAALVARFSPLLAIVTTAGWLAVGSWIRRQELLAMLGAWDRTRRAHYFRRLALEHRSAGEVRVFGLGPWLIDRFDEGWRAGMAASWRERAATGRRLFPLLAVLVAGNLAGLVVIARAGRAGDLAVDELAVVIAAFLGLAMVATPQQWTENLLWGATRLPALFDLEAIAQRESARVTPSPVVAQDASGRPQSVIRFDGVTFSYPGRDHAVLHDLDLELHAGESLAIVGVNGAGKTTLVKLLARLHDPTAGTITVDGIDLRAFEPGAWQRRVAAIFQEYARYPLPASDNVALVPLPMADLDDVARAVGADTVVDDLPNGWDTVLSRRYDGGAELSGGQWQRIALARAVHAVRAGAGLLVLDEPTANLDARGEAELFDRFLDLASGATTVLISHRFSTVRRADRIAVLDGGRITELGTHHELMALGGTYASLFSLQADRYDPAGGTVAP